MLSFPLNTESSPEAVLELLFKLKVKDVMSTGVLTASPKNTLREIQQLMKRSRITGVPIVEGKTLLGIISMDDIVNAFDNNWISDLAENHMTKKIIVMQDVMPVSFCVSYFNKFKFGRFPVINKENELAGIVTSTDVISSLLVAMNKEVERLEHETQFSPMLTIDSTYKNEVTQNNRQKTIAEEKILEFKTEPFNFEIAGQASTEIKKILKNRGIEPALNRRIGIASYELEINQVVHSNGGVMRYTITPDKLIIEAVDTGPGIPDLEKALTEGFSTASERVRSFGFGAGMGLPNTKRVSDDFDISSEVGVGTTVHARFNLQ